MYINSCLDNSSSLFRIIKPFKGQNHFGVNDEVLRPRLVLVQESSIKTETSKYLKTKLFAGPQIQFRFES